MVKTRKVVEAEFAVKKKNEAGQTKSPGNGKQKKMNAAGKINKPKVKTVKGGKAKKIVVPEVGESSQVQFEAVSQVAEAVVREGDNIVSYHLQNDDLSEGEVSEPDECENSESDEDTEVTLSSQNNNAARVDSEESTEELDYDDVRETADEGQGTSEQEDEDEYEEVKRLTKVIKADRKRKRKSEEHQKHTMAMMEEYCAENGFVLVKKPQKKQTTKQPTRSKSPESRRQGKSCIRTGTSKNKLPNNSQSEETIYQNAVRRVQQEDNREDVDSFWDLNKFSSSSEGPINTSDELDEEVVNQHLSERFVAECRIEDGKQKQRYRLPPPAAEVKVKAMVSRVVPGREEVTVRTEGRRLHPRDEVFSEMLILHKKEQTRSSEKPKQQKQGSTNCQVRKQL